MMPLEHHAKRLLSLRFGGGSMDFKQRFWRPVIMLHFGKIILLKCGKKIDESFHESV